MSKFSGQSYRPGDVILRCKIPFAYVVKEDLVEFTCDECLKTVTEENEEEKFLRCSGMYVMLRMWHELNYKSPTSLI